MQILNFAQMPIFSGLMLFNEAEIHRPQPGLNPRTLDPEASTLPRDHRGELKLGYCNLVYLYSEGGKIFQLFNLRFVGLVPRAP